MTNKIVGPAIFWLFMTALIEGTGRRRIRSARLGLSEHGWKKLAPSLIDLMNQYPGPSADERRPETCWVYDGLNPMVLE